MIPVPSNRHVQCRSTILRVLVTQFFSYYSARLSLITVVVFRLKTAITRNGKWPSTVSDVGCRTTTSFDMPKYDEYVTFSIITAIIVLYDCSGCICNIYRLIGNCEFSLLYRRVIWRMMVTTNYWRYLRLLTLFLMLFSEACPEGNTYLMTWKE